ADSSEKGKGAVRQQYWRSIRVRHPCSLPLTPHVSTWLADVGAWIRTAAGRYQDRSSPQRQPSGDKRISALGVETELVPHVVCGDSGTNVVFEAVRQRDQQIINSVFLDNP